MLLGLGFVAVLMEFVGVIMMQSGYNSTTPANTANPVITRHFFNISSVSSGIYFSIPWYHTKSKIKNSSSSLANLDYGTNLQLMAIV